jgi:plastocyanin
MKLSLLLLLAGALAACTDATASTDPPALIVTFSASPASPNACVVATPDPATIRAGQSVAFRNATSVSHVVVADGLDTPWTAIGPGETSGSIEFSIASTRKYYVQSCGNGSTNLHTLVITVN